MSSELNRRWKTKLAEPWNNVAEEELPNNVISLESYRRKGSAVPSHRVFYLTESGKWLENLSAFPALQIIPIDSIEELRARTANITPDLILLESNLGWADPIDLTAELHD